jgi:hypothetical protein
LQKSRGRKRETFPLNPLKKYRRKNVVDGDAFLRICSSQIVLQEMVIHFDIRSKLISTTLAGGSIRGPARNLGSDVVVLRGGAALARLPQFGNPIKNGALQC